MATTTVGLKKEAEVLNVTSVAEQDKPADRTTITNWNALYETGLTPTYFKCDGYKPVHLYNDGCHTTLQLKPQQLAAHLDNGHGGGYFVSFQEGFPNTEGGVCRQGKPWEGWKEFEKLGVEIKDLRCDICGDELKLTSRSILRHLKNHAGKSSRMKPGGGFWLTLSREFVGDFDEE